MKTALYVDFCMLVRRLPHLLLTALIVSTIPVVGMVLDTASGALLPTAFAELQVFVSMIVGFMLVYQLMFNAFRDDEANGWEQARDTLPLTRQQCVTGRYMFVLISLVMAGVIAVAFNMLTRFALQLSGTPIMDNARESLAAFLLGYQLLVVLLSLQMPVLFAWGAQRSTFVIMLPAVFPALRSLAAVRNALDAVASKALTLYTQLGWASSLVLLTLIVAALYVASLKLSQHIYARREL